MRAVTHDPSIAVPSILFGAFDRHNFGDLLFPHITSALLGERNLVFAGLVENDLRPCGGHRVEALAHLAARWRDRPVNLIHAGGELLTCNAWEAAVMTLRPQEAQNIIAHFRAHPREALEWAQGRLGVAAVAPYSVPRTLFPHAQSILYNAVGGVDLDEREEMLRSEVLTNLQAADQVGVRDATTQAHLHAAGIPASLMPDPAVMVAELFGDDIFRRASEGEPAQMQRAFPQGYIAVQFSGDFGDDATLGEIARQLDEIVDSTGCGIVFFRAGAAPWHDEADCFERAAARMRSRQVRMFKSLDLWDICALIASSRGYLGSSLHGRIVAMAFALPRVNLVYLPGVRSKQGAFAATWDDPGIPHVIAAQNMAEGMLRALETDEHSRRQKARELGARYRKEFDAIFGEDRLKPAGRGT